MDILEGEILPPSAISMAPHGRNNIAIQFVLPEGCIHVSDLGGQRCVYMILDRASARHLAQMAEDAANGISRNSHAH